jgi:hypothetical protein
VNSVRYFIALLLLLSLPPGLIFWFVIHPLVRYWRKLGPGWTYSLTGVIMAAMIAGLYFFREPFLAIEYGTSYPLIGLAAVCMTGSAFIAVKRQKQLTFRILAGLPELAPAGRGGELLTEGMYAVIRHPRYMEMLLGVLGWALAANYLATYILFILGIPTVYLVVILEERELRARFGVAYEEYCRRVPRFMPRLGAGRS